MHLFQASLAYMGAVGAMHAHPNADVEKGSQTVGKMYYNSLARLPYLTGGKSGDDMIQEDRMRSVERYKEMERNLTRKPDAKLVKKKAHGN